MYVRKLPILICTAVSARKCEEFLWSARIALFDVAWD